MTKIKDFDFKNATLEEFLNEFKKQFKKEFDKTKNSLNEINIENKINSVLGEMGVNVLKNDEYDYDIEVVQLPIYDDDPDIFVDIKMKSKELHVHDSLYSLDLMNIEFFNLNTEDVGYAIYISGEISEYAYHESLKQFSNRKILDCPITKLLSVLSYHDASIQIKELHKEMASKIRRLEDIRKKIEIAERTVRDEHLIKEYKDWIKAHEGENNA